MAPDFSIFLTSFLSSSFIVTIINVTNYERRPSRCLRFHHPHRSDRRRRAGPTAGIALTDAGIEATVYEAYQSSASGVGGALSIAPNGLDAWMRSAPVTIARYEELRRKRVEPIIAAAARTNSNKAAGPVARVVRDRLMPVTMKLTRPEKATWQYDHHIDWAAAA